ncbi:hypothetical protein [Streptomyces longhuiensis]|uniref:hypothetical protein n=1 Tax=Streptomyces longhuiensis TaxID=2880933 RepID=UPI001D0AEC20|nr:hypothetical protein [Streptomyces longhuiensis]UDM00068.1 hypothetical protein LGI35_18170 [Streptomyces longhuiensis]
MNRTATAVGLLVAATLALTACSGAADDKPADPKKLDDAASLACDDFARGYKAAQTQSARVDLANKVNKWAQQSITNNIADNATALARGSEASPSAWKLGADAFAQSCLDAGWKA